MSPSSRLRPTPPYRRQRGRLSRSRGLFSPRSPTGGVRNSVPSFVRPAAGPLLELDPFDCLLVSRSRYSHVQPRCELAEAEALVVARLCQALYRADESRVPRPPVHTTHLPASGPLFVERSTAVSAPATARSHVVRPDRGRGAGGAARRRRRHSYMLGARSGPQATRAPAHRRLRVSKRRAAASWRPFPPTRPFLSHAPTLQQAEGDDERPRAAPAAPPAGAAAAVEEGEGGGCGALPAFPPHAAAPARAPPPAPGRATRPLPAAPAAPTAPVAPAAPAAQQLWRGGHCAGGGWPRGGARPPAAPAPLGRSPGAPPGGDACALHAGAGGGVVGRRRQQ